MSLAPGARLGPYEIAAKLGEGGMGEVYRATDSKLEREVAIKVLPAAFTEDPERLARFEREAKLLAQLHHPHIASIFGLEESGGIRALVMELVEGPTLADRLTEERLSTDECLAIARQIAEALEEAHEKGIVHRDLKPQNIKASREGKVKVLDFGLAKAMDPTAGASGAATASPTLMNSPTLTAAGTELGMILGTAAYMAPEQARGLPVDKRADLWALGVILFEMLAGRRLFEGELVSDLLASVLRQPIDWSALPADAPPALRRLLRRLLERNPKNRLHDAADARIVLADLAAGVADEIAPAPAAPAARGRRELVAWALALLAMAVAGWLSLGRPKGAPPPARVIRATLPLPAGVSIELDGERAGMPAISHDGTRVAVGAREGAGPMRIWVVEVATGVARALPGTEDGYRPFWSPDDRTIGFFTWSFMGTTPAEGGAVRRLARARDARGGTWSPNGTILFAPHQVGPLYTIPERGGEARPATAIGEAGNLGTHRFPAFLPDGERFVYLERHFHVGSEPSRAAVTLGRLGATEPLARLLEVGTNAEVAGGRLLYVRDGALVAQPLDLERGALAGEPRTLVGDLLVNLRFSYGVFSASDTGLLAFLAGRQSDLSQLVWRDRSGRRLGELGAPGILSGLGGLALSLDGRFAAVSRIEEGTTEADVWLYDLSRGTETRLARPGSDDYRPLFAPDSTALVFGSRERSGGAARIVRRDLGTGEERELLRQSGRYLLPGVLTADGEGLLYERGDEEDLGVCDVLLHSLAGGEERTLVASPGDDSAAQLSPDGRWLAWASDQSGQYEIYVAPFPGPGAPVQVSRAGGVQPRWNPRGGELFFKSPDNVLTAVPVESGSATFAAGTPEPLFPIVEFLGWTYAVAPDGERFLTREPLGERDVSPITLLTDWTALADGRRP